MENKEVIMHKIFSYSVTYDENKLFKLPYKICNGELPNETYNQFKWDKINRLDFPEQNKILDFVREIILMIH